jgi:ATP-dependent protease ClpP protease subunit
MNVQFSAKGNRGEIWLYDQIGQSFFGEGISAKAFQQELAGLGKITSLNVRINSPGGDVFDGFAIYNQLVQHPAKIEVTVDGLAGSIASVIAMAASPGSLTMAKNALMMIHDPSGMAIGDESEMLRVAALLRTIKGNLVQTYADRTNGSEKEITQWMSDETWFTAKTAVQYGFADTIGAESVVTACFDLSQYKHVPDELRRRAQDAISQPNLNMRRQRLYEQGQRVAAVLRAA